MAKARPFSIFLLKEDFAEPGAALKEDHELFEATTTPARPEYPWQIFLSRNAPSPPWWRDYFAISDPLERGYAGAIVFVRAKSRTFALTFGQTRHSLRDEAYEYDFGLRTTLNAVNPDEIRNTDELDPSTARRRRTQVPERSDISYFDFDGESAVLKSLTGAIRPEYRDLFSHAKGASNLRVSTDKGASELLPLLDQIYDVYKRTTYLTAFPAANNIQPVRDPATLNRLDSRLLEAFQAGQEGLVLTIPELVDFQEDFEIQYAGRGKSNLHSDALLEDYIAYLSSHGMRASDTDIASLQHDRLQVLTADGVRKGNYSIYRCLVFETSLDGSSDAFHVSEGRWYRVDSEYLTKLTRDLDPYFVESEFPPRTEHIERLYCEKQLVPHLEGSVLLDSTSIGPAGQKQIEPCDVGRVENGQLVLTHVKLGVKAADLSHLFNQGTNSVDLLNGVEEARTKLHNLLKSYDPSFDMTPLSKTRFRVEYVIVTKNDSGLKSRALPLFSRISLRRACQSLTSMKTPVTVHLVEDHDQAKSREKPRNKKQNRATP